MSISAQQVKELRTKTGIGFMDCKQALEETGGDMEKAIEYLRKKGLATAAKKAGRATKQGLVTSYIHGNGKIGVLLEINCETDFVARTRDFQELAKDIAMQIAASKPLYVSREDVPAECIEKEKEIVRAQIGDTKKPEEILMKIIEGKLEKGFYAKVCLLDQPFIKDDTKTVKSLITDKIAQLGENITISRFARYELGELAE
ncbi:MAG: translation elongation factor Ts [bacterium]|nr:translation elongation factor Ts [bacterium]